MKTELEIEIEKQDDSIHVEYSLSINNRDIEISGQLRPYHTGRAIEYEFEPSWFSSKQSELYYDENWEKVESQILDIFYTTSFENGGEISETKEKLSELIENMNHHEYQYFCEKNDVDDDEADEMIEFINAVSETKALLLISEIQSGTYNPIKVGAEVIVIGMEQPYINYDAEITKIISPNLIEVTDADNKSSVVTINQIEFEVDDDDDYTNAMMYDKGGSIDKQAFGLLTFEDLEDLFDVKLFGLENEEVEKELNELRKEWYDMDEKERIKILNDFVPDWREEFEYKN